MANMRHTSRLGTWPGKDTCRIRSIMLTRIWPKVLIVCALQKRDILNCILSPFQDVKGGISSQNRPKRGGEIPFMAYFRPFLDCHKLGPFPAEARNYALFACPGRLAGECLNVTRVGHVSFPSFFRGQGDAQAAQSGRLRPPAPLFQNSL